MKYSNEARGEGWSPGGSPWSPRRECAVPPLYQRPLEVGYRGRSLQPQGQSRELGQGGGGLRVLSALASRTRCAAVSWHLLHLDCWGIAEAGGDL